MYDNVLYIIGNGFDRHHEVKSSYQHFANWLKKNNWELYGILSEVCKVDFLWKDFERALSYVNRDYFINMGETILPDSWTEDDNYADLLYAQDLVREEALQRLTCPLARSGDDDRKCGRVIFLI
jgi:hypothetical protein